MNPDPYYRSAPAQWMAAVTSGLTGMEVVVDQSLPDDLACRLDHRARVIQLAPGLSLVSYQWALARAVLLDRFGPEQVPEFGPAPRRLRLVRSTEYVPDLSARYGLGGA
jgi:hypothetical protein